MSHAGALLAALVLLAAAPASAQYLFTIPTDSPAGVSASIDAPLHVAVRADDLAGLARVLGVPAPAAGAERLEITLDAYPQLAGSATQDTRAASFFIDYDQPSVQSARAGLVQRFGTHPTRDELARFVSEWIVEKTLERSMDTASQVASRRAGDCTEHAVLLAALARSTGLDARVAVGMALMLEGGRYQAFGHAWAEIRADGRWVVADAALLGRAARHVPFGILVDEGPSLPLGLVQILPRWITRIEVLPDAAS